MKSLNTLIKLNKSKLDSLVLEINSLSAEKSNKVNTLKDLIEKVNKEQSDFTGTSYATFLEQYVKHETKNQEDLKDYIGNLDRKIDNLGQRLSEQFSELKKLEIVSANNIKKQKAIEKKLETKQMDEFAISNFNQGK